MCFATCEYVQPSGAVGWFRASSLMPMNEAMKRARADEPLGHKALHRAGCVTAFVPRFKDLPGVNRLVVDVVREQCPQVVALSADVGRRLGQFVTRKCEQLRCHFARSFKELNDCFFNRTSHNWPPPAFYMAAEARGCETCLSGRYFLPWPWLPGPDVSGVTTAVVPATAGEAVGVVVVVEVAAFLPFWRWSPLLPTVQSIGPPGDAPWPRAAGLTSSQPWPFECGSAWAVAADVVGVSVAVSVAVAVAVVVSVGVGVAVLVTPFWRWSPLLPTVHPTGPPGPGVKAAAWMMSSQPCPLL